MVPHGHSNPQQTTRQYGHSSGVAGRLFGIYTRYLHCLNNHPVDSERQINFIDSTFPYSTLTWRKINPRDNGGIFGWMYRSILILLSRPAVATPNQIFGSRACWNPEGGNKQGWSKTVPSVNQKTLFLQLEAKVSFKYCSAHLYLHDSPHWYRHVMIQ